MTAHAVRPRARRGRPPTTQSDNTRSAILVAARRCFAELGYEAASIKQIAETAHLTHNAIYHYFDSKRDLFFAVMDDVDRRLLSEYEQALAGTTGFANRLSKLVDATVALHREDPSIARFTSIAQIETHRLAGLQTTSPPDPGEVIPLIAKIVIDAKEAQELSAHTDPDAVVSMILAMTLGMALYATLIDPDGYEAIFMEAKRLFAGELIQHRGNGP